MGQLAGWAGSLLPEQPNCQGNQTAPTPVLFFVVKDAAIKGRSRGKTTIKVQPGSQRRRDSKIGSRQKQSSGRKLTLPVPVIRPIGSHSFAGNVSNNERIPDKAKSAMKSKTLRKRKEASTNTTSKIMYINKETKTQVSHRRMVKRIPNLQLQKGF